MAWSKYVWVENVTKAVAARFNNEESGIEEALTESIVESRLPPSVVSSSQNLIYITNHGAVSGKDSTAAIIAAQKESKELPGSGGIFFPEGEWIYSETLRQEVPWAGVPRKSILKQASVFTYLHGGGWALQNANFNNTYNSATAAQVSIDGIDFVFQNSEGTEKNGWGFGNVAGGHMTDCHLGTEGTGMLTSLDVFAAVRNLIFTQVRGINSTGAEHGGHWVSNACAPASEAAARENATENIVFNDCYFATSTGDEALAIFSAGGMTRRVRMNRCVIESLASTWKHNHIASTSLITAAGTHAYAAVEDVDWYDCTFIDTSGNLNAGETVLTFGVGSDAGYSKTRLQKIRHRDCTFVLITANGATVSRNVPNTYEGAESGNTAIDPTIIATGSTGVVGIAGFPTVVNPTIAGVTIGCKECGEVLGGGHIEATEHEYLKSTVSLTEESPVVWPSPSVIGERHYSLAGVPITNPYGLRRWRSALADALNAEAPIVCIGDSHTFGQNANGVDETKPSFSEADGQLNYVGQLRQLFARIYGDPGEGIWIPNYVVEGRVVPSPEEARTFAEAGQAFYLLRNNYRLLPTNTITITVPNGVTRMIVLRANRAGAVEAAGTWKLNGVSQGSIGALTETGLPLLTYLNVVPGQTVVLEGPATKYETYIGFGFRTAQTAGVPAHRVGRSGYVQANMIGGAYNGVLGKTTSGGTPLTETEMKERVRWHYKWAGAKGLVILMWGTNEQSKQLETGFEGGVTPAIFATGLRLTVNQIVSDGWCCLLVSPCPSASQNNTAGAEPLSAYAAKQREIAETTDHCAFIDMADLWGAYSTANLKATYEAGLRAEGDSHPTRAGYGDIARNLHRVLNAVVPIGN